MTCPRCGGTMQEHTLDSHLAQPVVIDLCEPCQSLWFDGRESLQLSPGSTLALFRVIGERVSRPQLRDADASKCPRCNGRLRRTQDMQRATRFEYFRCPNAHGRFISFVEFLKEKDFLRPVTPQQLAELRRNVQSVNCSNCGAPVDLASGAACGHCGSPLSMLDLEQADRLLSRLRGADRTDRPVDPALPLELARARRAAEAAFHGVPHGIVWYADVASTGLVGAGLQLIARWLQARR